MRVDWLVIPLTFDTRFLKSLSDSRELGLVVNNRRFIDQFFFIFNKSSVKLINSVGHFIEGVLIPAQIPKVVLGCKETKLPQRQTGITQSCLWHTTYINRFILDFAANPQYPKNSGNLNQPYREDKPDLFDEGENPDDL